MKIVWRIPIVHSSMNAAYLTNKLFGTFKNICMVVSTIQISYIAMLENDLIGFIPKIAFLCIQYPSQEIQFVLPFLF